MNEFKPLSAEVLQELAEELAIIPLFWRKIGMPRKHYGYYKG